MILLGQFLRLQRTALLIWGAIMLMMALATAGAAPAITAGGSFEALIQSLGPVMSQAAGGDITRFASPVDAYLSMKLLGFLPVMIGVYVVLATGAIIVRERAQGTLDFLLALPLDRAQVLRWRVLGVALITGLLYLIAYVGIIGGLASGGVRGSYDRYALALLAGYGVNLAQGGLVLLLSLRLREYVQTVRWGLALVLGAYLFVMSMQVGNLLPMLRNLLLFGLANPFPIVADGLFPVGAVLVGIGGSALGLTLGAGMLDRQELQ